MALNAQVDSSIDRQTQKRSEDILLAIVYSAFTRTSELQFDGYFRDEQQQNSEQQICLRTMGESPSTNECVR